MSSTYPTSPVPSDADLWPGELPFTAFGQWGADKIDLRVFDQDLWWVDRLGQAHRLEEMSSDYRANVLIFLRARAADWHLLCSLRAAAQAAGDALLGRVSGELLAAELTGSWTGDLDPDVWLESTPLVRRLAELAAADAAARRR